MNKNSLDLLRLLAATMVLFSHQYALLGLTEPSFMGWNTFGGVGVTVFFFLSGFLVWNSWKRDPDVRRFFLRRSLRIFPALWVVCLLSVFLLGPMSTGLSLGDYFASTSTWRYLRTALLVSPNTLPEVFPGNPMPLLVNGSLWTLPVEYLCYVTVAVVGVGMLLVRRQYGLLLATSLLVVVLAATYGTLLVGDRFTPHLEMVAMFWWGVYYGNALEDRPAGPGLIVAVLALLIFASLGSRSAERTAMLGLSVVLVHCFRLVSAGAWLTDKIGELSYGVYIFTFPVQQLVISWGRGYQWEFDTYLTTSLLVTLCLAYLSGHVIEKRALFYKPSTKEIT